MSKDNDFLHRFVFEQFAVRGEFVRLSDSWQAVRDKHAYPSSIESQLGQALAAVLLLSGTIKFKGALTLQLQGDGDLQSLIVQATEQRTIRGMAQYAEQLSGVADLQALLGNSARVMLTAEAQNGERYQGIVPVEQPKLAGAVEGYFMQSEQLPTRICLVANEAYAAGLLLQRLPADDQQDNENWQRVSLLADTLSDAEMLSLDVQTLLHRLFHEETVRLFEPEPVSFSCSCSRERIEHALISMGEGEVAQILDEVGVIEANCEFCNAKYRFDSVDAALLFNQPQSSGSGSSRVH